MSPSLSLSPLPPSSRAACPSLYISNRQYFAFRSFPTSRRVVRLAGNHLSDNTKERYTRPERYFISVSMLWVGCWYAPFDVLAPLSALINIIHRAIAFVLERQLQTAVAISPINQLIRINHASLPEGKPRP